MRQLLCIPCGKTYRRGTYELYPPADHEPGEWVRVVDGIAGTPAPAQRRMSINGAPLALAAGHYNCDFCNGQIRPGERVVAVTGWQPARGPEPGQWEAEYFALEPGATPSTVSTEPTPWAVTCTTHQTVYLAEAEYNRQMNQPDALWVCPICGDRADWDDDNYERAMEGEPDADAPPV